MSLYNFKADRHGLGLLRFLDKGGTEGFEFQMGRGGLGKMPSPGKSDGTASKGTLMLLLCLADLHPEKEQVSTKTFLKVVASNPMVFKEYFLSLGSRKVWLRRASKEK